MTKKELLQALTHVQIRMTAPFYGLDGANTVIDKSIDALSEVMDRVRSDLWEE